MGTKTWAQYFEEEEQMNGVRMSWNVLPLQRVEADNLTIPIGCLYTLWKENCSFKPCPPIDCTNAACSAILNRFCQVNHEAWLCCFCEKWSRIPAQYLNMPPNDWLEEQFRTVEYALTSQPPKPPIFLYVVDTCMDQTELTALKQALQLSVQLLPRNALVGLITFNRGVHLHFLDCEFISANYFFSGIKNYTGEEIKTKLNSGAVYPRLTGAPQGAAFNVSGRFLQPVVQCENRLIDLLNNIQQDLHPVLKGERPLRSTGVALSIAVGLLESYYGDTAARIMLFVGGPCSSGPGQVVDKELKSPIRSHHDINQNKAKFMNEAIKHYEELSKQACNSGHTIDIYACALDQTGLLEMKSCSNTTGGHMVMSESFTSAQLFNETFKRSLARDDDPTKHPQDRHLKMAFNVELEVKTSKELKIRGAIGPCVSMNLKKPNVSETEIAIGGTSHWKFCSVGRNTTTAIYFEVDNFGASVPSTGNCYIQFITQYQHPDGTNRKRVTTIARPMIKETNFVDNGFDYLASAVLMARRAAFKADSKESGVREWLDRMLIRSFRKLAIDLKNFRISAHLLEYAQYMFHLRRSDLLNEFNNSPDETTYYRNMLYRGDMDECLRMIQPHLQSFSLCGPEDGQLVVLDASSIMPDRILLLDTFFQIVIYRGEDIVRWYAEGYHTVPEFESFAKLLQVPVDHAEEILKKRFPVPRYIETEREGSQARFLLSKVNPSQTHNTSMVDPNNGALVLTDDANLDIFIYHLKRHAVSE